MSAQVPRGPGLDDDPTLKQLADQLDEYERDHAGASTELYRRGKYLVRVRVTDPAFIAMRESERHRAVWEYLKRLPEEVYGDVTFLVAVSPQERDSGPSREFDNPTPIDGPPGWFDTTGWPVPLPGPVMRQPPGDVYGDQPLVPPPSP